ncbi:MAG TPA: protoglobin domain-containing protein [Terracidiphilus sp.]|nr:protoglobin domain-containing protein [Terracidiphilus sp.]
MVFQWLLPSPVTLDELREIEPSIGCSEEDAETLRRHKTLFDQRAEQMVEQWRAVIGSQPHLVKWFFGPDGKRDDEYAAKVKPRFVQWVIDVCLRPDDQAWLNYQEEIGLRHLPAKRNQTDKRSTPALVPLRFLLAFVPVIVISARQFFLEGGVEGEELERLEGAWAKAVQLHVTLWTRPYAKEGLW